LFRFITASLSMGCAMVTKEMNARMNVSGVFLMDGRNWRNLYRNIKTNEGSNRSMA